MMRLYGAGFALAAGDTLQVLGEEKMCRIGGEDAGSCVYSGDFPRAQPEAQWIRIQTAAASSLRVTVRAKARWV